MSTDATSGSEPQGFGDIIRDEPTRWRVMAIAERMVAEAEKRGAVKALRAEVEYFIGASKSAVLDESTRRTADGAAAHLRSMADRIESGEVTLS